MVAQETIRILVVDDEPTSRLTLKRQLNRAGFQNVFDTCDPEIAEIKIKSGEVDLVIADWYMPEISGLDLLHVLQKTKRKVPFIMVTSEGDREKVGEALHEGVSAYLLKPFDESLFLDTVFDALER